MANLDGRVVLITGGSAGLGMAAARRLSDSGASVVTASRHEPTDTTDHWVRLDLLDPESVGTAVEAVVKRYGRLDALVASGAGGRVRSRPFLETPSGDYLRHLEGNLLARLNAIGAVAPAMAQAGYGKIVVLTTDAGRVPTPGQSLSGSAAAAMIFAVRALGREFASSGIRVNGISLSLTRDTPSYERFEKDQNGPTLQRVFQQLEKRAAFGLNTPAQVADVIHFLCSPASDQISGQVLSVNGGASFP